MMRRTETESSSSSTEESSSMPGGSLGRYASGRADDARGKLVTSVRALGGFASKYARIDDVEEAASSSRGWEYAMTMSEPESGP
jgi:hypothetical protein